MLREAKHSRSRRTPFPHTAAMAMQGILTTQAAGRTPCSACAARGSVGVLRLHVSHASRETHYAQDDRLNLASRNFLIGPSLIPPQTASVLPISRPDLPTEGSSTQSKQSSSTFSNPSIASLVRWPSEHHQSSRNTPSDHSDTYWRILRFHHACAPKL